MFRFSGLRAVFCATAVRRAMTTTGVPGGYSGNTKTTLKSPSDLHLPPLNTEQTMRSLIEQLCPGLGYELHCSDGFSPHNVVATATFADGKGLDGTLFARPEDAQRPGEGTQEFSDLMETMKGLVRNRGDKATVPLWVFLLFDFLRRRPDIASCFDEILANTERSERTQRKSALANMIASHYGVSVDCIFHMSSPASCYNDLSDYVYTMLADFKHVSLVKLLQRGSNTRKRLLGDCKGRRLIDRETYIGSGAWSRPDSLPDYWLNHGIELERGSQAVLMHLHETASVVKVMAHTNFTQPLILSGESGSGKTCALLAAGGSHDVNIATAAEDVVQDCTIIENDKARSIQNMVDTVDKYVTTALQMALAQSDNSNESEALKVMLHLDEVSCDRDTKARTLIHAAADLHTPHRVQTPNGSILLSISIAMAGTGLSSLLNCAPGSLAGKFRLIPVEPPRADELNKIVKLHLKCHKGAVDVVMAQREFRDVVATNMRLLSFSLRALATVLGTPIELNNSDKPPDINVKYVIPPPATTMSSVVHALRYACSVGVIHFVNANGLSNLSEDFRLTLLRLSHKAYLDRVVLVDDDNALRDQRLIAAGFTPLRQGPGPEGDTFRALRRAERMGIFTTTEVEKKLPLESGWVQTTAASGGVAMAVREGCLPLRMSTAYRMLPRLLSGTLFSKGSPQDFEEFMAELCYQGLIAADGTCPYNTLLAAVCGPVYAMRYASGALRGPRNDPPQLVLSYTHVVKVALGFKLRPCEDCYNDVAVACAKALQEQYPNPELAAQLELVKKIAEEKDVTAFVEDTRRRFLCNKVFILVPAERSPSADTIIMCVSDSTPYLGGVQDKRYVAGDVPEETYKHEIGKMSQTSQLMRSLMRLSGAKAVECFFPLYKEQAYMPTGRLCQQTVHTFVHNDINLFELTGKLCTNNRIF